ncbi:acetyl-coenzyme A synthetase N-terminal domain-containing protein [Georgenia ruanii]|uniref:acetyl-coenzyme A synthetase N-terminal domain-containing protein n=1 Tax=Georgenia ruanii TaxID=348442 RepID=UPI001264CE86
MSSGRVFSPARAVAKPPLYDEAAADREAFWGRQAHEILTWTRISTRSSTGLTRPFARWFVAAQRLLQLRRPAPRGRPR